MIISSFSFRRAWLAGLAMLTLLTGCTDPYLPDVVGNPPNYLVVDGFLNSQGVTTIRLSRTYAIAAKTPPPVETRATVYIEDEAGTRVALTEIAVRGTYVSTAQVLDPARKYRLRIATLPGKNYASAFVPVKTTPPIDAVNWRTDNAGVNIYVNTHDPANATHYYRWESEETWEITPPYRPSVEYVNGRMRDILVPLPTLCWGSAHSTTVQIDKTVALTQDVVSDFRLRQLPISSERLYTRFSTLVQQHALTRDEYEYWELLRKNNESIGSLFDAQPSQVTGNVHNLDAPAEVVLGYVGAHSLSEKRIFIDYTQLPSSWKLLHGYEKCLPPDTVFIDRPSPPPPNVAQILQTAFGAGAFLPIDFVHGPNFLGYTTKSRDCVDCRTRGTATRPSFW